jgi:anaerobic ribonucleoside-triphosphate reductase activating protein
VCAFTGYLYENLVSDTTDAKYRLLQNVDILVDGPFVESEKSMDLKFKGSRNQRTIDVAKSLAAGKAVETDSPRWV